MKTLNIEFALLLYCASPALILSLIKNRLYFADTDYIMVLWSCSALIFAYQGINVLKLLRSKQKI